MASGNMHQTDPISPSSCENATPETGADRGSSLVSRNISIQGHRTSIRLEPEMWQALRDIARREGCTIHVICTLVALRKRTQSSLTAAIRVFVMLYFRAASTEEGHRRAGHGSLSQMAARAGVPPVWHGRAVQEQQERQAAQPPLALSVDLDGFDTMPKVSRT